MSSEKKILINKRQKGLPREELEKLSKTELVDKVVQLEAYNFQLRNLLQKKLNQNEKTDAEYAAALHEQRPIKTPTNVSNRSDKQRPFDWASAHKRHVLLKILYFGWDYQGYACQEDSNDTIESQLFRALTRTCLIESRASSNYHRCGRTDKEVSAFSQVISIDLRSKHPVEKQHELDALSSEIDYCGLLNRVLPKNIQCVAWMPLRSELYSARFDCIARTYRYYFPKGDLNIEAMRAACRLLVNHADFRNFCKMDVHNGVTNYMRNLQAAHVQECNRPSAVKNGYAMYYLEIKANAFLWHQIRCIMAVLLLIGQGHEQPDVITDLLDVSTNPCKPQYTPAHGLPLNLFHCDFRAHTTRTENSQPIEEAELAVPISSEKNNPIADTSEWIYNQENLQKLIENVQSEWTQFSVKSTMILNVLEVMESLLSNEFPSSEPVLSQVLLLQDAPRPRQYQKLLERKRCESLENRIQHFVKKQRLIVQPE